MIGVLVSGEGSNLQALLDAGLPVAAVASNRPGVRALERAEAAGVAGGGVPARRVRRPRAARRDDGELAAGARRRLVVCAGYMHLLTPPFLDRFPERIVNVHPSLLPEFPGARAIDEALAAGVETTGVTVHLVDEGLDTGAGDPPGARAGRAARDARRADPRGRAPAAARGGERAVRALISVWDKTGLDGFARGSPRSAGSSSRAAAPPRYIEELGLQVTSVESLTEFPEMLGGRVKTLHPRDPRRHPRAARGRTRTWPRSTSTGSSRSTSSASTSTRSSRWRGSTASARRRPSR